MCQEGFAQCCPVLNELCALRKYKAQAEIRLAELEAAEARNRSFEASLEQERTRIQDLERKIRQMEYDKSAELKVFEVERLNLQDAVRRTELYRKQVEDVSTENLKLESEVSHYKQELKAWSNLANSIWRSHPSGDFPQEFPYSDLEKQRKVILDAIHKVSEADEEHLKYRRLLSKFEETKSSLRALQRKWEQMQRCVRTSCDDFDNENSRCTENAMKRFGRHVKSLSQVTRKIKDDYLYGRIVQRQ
jgi:hypothetical protein